MNKQKKKIGGEMNEKGKLLKKRIILVWLTTPYELKLRFAIQIDTKAETTWVETLYYHDKIIAI